MNRIAISAILFSIFFLGQAASAAEPPKPLELKVLEKFVGTCDVEVVIEPAVWTHTEKREKSIEVNEMSLDGWFLHGSSKTTAGKTNAILMNTYDPAQKNYRTWRFIPGGSCEEMRGEWDGVASTLTFTTDLGHGITQKASFHLIDKDRREYDIRAKDTVGRVWAVIIHTATGEHLRELEDFFQDVLTTPSANPQPIPDKEGEDT